MEKRLYFCKGGYVIIRSHNHELFVVLFHGGVALWFPLRRWLKFTTTGIDLEDETISIYKEAPFQLGDLLHCNIGGCWRLKTKQGNEVDIRISSFKRIRNPCYIATKHGITLQMNQWNKLKRLVRYINIKFPVISKEQYCKRAIYHPDPISGKLCDECYPEVGRDQYNCMYD